MANVHLYRVPTMSGALKKISDMIRQSVDAEKKTIIFCEDDLTLALENTVCEALGGGLFDPNVYSFSRFLGTFSGEDLSGRVLSSQGSAMVMRRIIEKNRDSLSCFKKLASPRAAAAIYDTISLLYSSHVDVEDLKGKDYGNNALLKKKMDDICLLYDEYFRYLQDNKAYDKNTYLSLLPKIIRESGEMFYTVDGKKRRTDVIFVGFHSFSYTASLTLSTCMDLCGNVSGILVGGDESVYTNETVVAFSECAERTGSIGRSDEPSTLNHDAEIVRKNIFDAAVFSEESRETGNVHLFEAADQEEELEYVAAKIRQIVARGERYKNISVMMPDLDNARPMILRVFSQYEIPFYIDGALPLTSCPICDFICDLLACRTGNCHPEDVDAVIANPLFDVVDRSVPSPVAESVTAEDEDSGDVGLPSEQSCDDLAAFGNFGASPVTDLKQQKDIFRNYVVRLANFRGGVKRQPDKDMCENLGFDYATVCLVRERFLALVDMIPSHGTGNEYYNAITAILKTVGAEQRLIDISQTFSYVRAAESALFARAYKECDGIIDEASSLLGEDVIKCVDYARFIKSGLMSDKVSLIPQTQDAVFVGDISNTTNIGTNYLFAVGMTSAVPHVVNDTALLTEREISELEKLSFGLKDDDAPNHASDSSSNGGDSSANPGADSSANPGADSSSNSGTDASLNVGADASSNAGTDASLNAGSDVSGNAVDDFVDGAKDAEPRTVSRDVAVGGVGNGKVSESEKNKAPKFMISPKLSALNGRYRETVGLNLCSFKKDLYISYPLRSGGNDDVVPSEIIAYMNAMFWCKEEKNEEGMSGDDARRDNAREDGTNGDDARRDNARRDNARGDDKKLVVLDMETAMKDEEFMSYVCSRKIPALRQLFNSDEKKAAAVKKFLCDVGLSEEVESVKRPPRAKDRIKYGKEIFIKGGDVSPTALENWFSCPYKAFMDRGLGVTRRKTSGDMSLDIGTFVHLVLQTVFKPPVTYKKGDEAKVVADTRSHCKDLLSRPPYIALLSQKSGEYTAEALVDETVKVCLGAFAQIVDSDFDVTASEKVYSLSVDNGVRVSGKIDRIDTDSSGDFVRVIDYKTGSIDATTNKYYMGQKLQLELYLKAVAEQDGKTPIGAYYFPASVGYESDEDESSGVFPMRGFMNGEPHAIMMNDASLKEGKKDDPSQFLDKVKLGKYSGGAMHGDEFPDFLEYGRLVAQNGVNEMSEGIIAPSPAGNNCDYCSYNGMCGYTEREYGPPRERSAVSFSGISDIVRKTKESKDCTGAASCADDGSNGSDGTATGDGYAATDDGEVK